MSRLDTWLETATEKIIVGINNRVQQPNTTSPTPSVPWYKSSESEDEDAAELIPVSRDVRGILEEHFEKQL